jgi:hypothetical protein
MRRIGPLSLGVIALLAGCSSGDGASAPSAATIAVGDLPGTLPPRSTTTTSTEPPATTVLTPPTVLAAELAELVGSAPAAAPPMDVVAGGRLHIQVPVEWSDRRTEPSIAASTDLAAFLDGYGAPGLTAVLVREAPAEALRAYEFSEDCEPLREGGYRTERLEGVYRSWRACGGTGTGIVAVAAETGGETVLVLAQVVGGADLAAVDAALAGVEVTG